MSPELVGVIGLCLLFVLIFLNMPIGLTMAFVGIVGICVVAGIKPALSTLAVEPFSLASTYLFSVIPLFVFMGYLAGHTGLSSDAFYALNKWIGHMRGGIAGATSAACAMFAAICGDAIATATTMGVVALPEMRKYKYSDSLSLGCIAASGNLGFLIPPSIPFILYATLTEQSIGTLFMSGIVPGVVMLFLFLGTIALLVKINPKIASPSPKASWGERLKASRFFIGIFIIVVLVLGGIYGGLFTPTEAAAVGVFGVFVLGFLNRRITRQGFVGSLRETARMTGMIFILIIGALIFSRFMTISDIPFKLGAYISGLDIPSIYVLIVALIFYILVGMIMNVMAVMLIMTPILHPLLVALGFDPVWLATVTVVVIMMGGVSPPVGIVVYALSGMVKNVPMFTIFRGALPFMGSMFVGLVLLVAFPQIALILPHLMRPG
ncbi:C4-dicarboxylate TRAP transporter large permease protein DctM [subsurface metagenome]